MKKVKIGSLILLRDLETGMNTIFKIVCNDKNDNFVKAIPDDKKLKSFEVKISKFNIWENDVEDFNVDFVCKKEKNPEMGYIETEEIVEEITPKRRKKRKTTLQTAGEKEQKIKERREKKEEKARKRTEKIKEKEEKRAIKLKKKQEKENLIKEKKELKIKKKEETKPKGKRGRPKKNINNSNLKKEESVYDYLENIGCFSVPLLINKNELHGTVLIKPKGKRGRPKKNV